DVVVLPQVDNSALLARLQLSLVGRMFHLGGRSIEALVSLLPKEHIWDVEGKVRGVSLGGSRFQFFFESEADIQKILNKRPCHFNKWSFALERWQPHIGTSFPNSMTFWIRLEGIPSEFWTEETLRNFGNSFGTTLLVDTTNGRIQVTVQADAPLRFNKPAQLQTGEIVKVKLFYEKLYRWCIHCRRLCHEIEACPLLDSDQKALLSSANGGLNRSQSLSTHPNRTLSLSGAKSKERNRNSSIAPVSRPTNNRYHHQSSGSHRRPHNSDSQAARPLLPQKRSAPADPKGKSVDEGRKRRYDDSFRQENASESSRRGRGAHSSKEMSSPTRGRDEPSAISDSQLTVSDPILFPHRAKQGFESPALANERPFRLHLAKRLSASEKGKGKEPSLPEHSPNSTETGSSAKKSLTFLKNAQAPGGSASLQPLSLPGSDSQPEKEKSWYEQTVEEEEKERAEDPEAFLAKQFSQSVSFASPRGALSRRNPIPSLHDAETDWIGNSNTLPEALQLDWTAEDQAAYNALDSPRFSDEEDFAVEEDDLLGEEFQDALDSQSAEPPKSLDVSSEVKKLSVKLKSSIVAGSGIGPEAEGESSTKVLGLARPKAKKKESTKK
ncbi:unnamed protein product, partial [Arabidopsis halleri]